MAAALRRNNNNIFPPNNNGEPDLSIIFSPDTMIIDTSCPTVTYVSYAFRIICMI